MKSDLQYLKPLVAAVLREPRREWTVQGFGFLRTYFGPTDYPKQFRLNLWDSRFSVPNVSTIHDHPWHFSSVIVAGAFCNLRYAMSPFAQGDGDSFGMTHCYTTIKTGEGGGLEKTPTKTCCLTARRPELYKPGDTYSQVADEIHETIFSDGTITLNERTRVGDGEHARVFWPTGTDWVDAIPRPATTGEVADAVAASLREWF